MDPQGLAVLISAVAGAILGAASLVMRRLDKRRDDVVDGRSVAVKELEAAVSFLGKENNRLHAELERAERRISELETKLRRLEGS